MLERPQKGAPKRMMSCMLKILILIGEIKYHLLELMEVEMISWTIWVQPHYKEPYMPP
jgi:hypothetical protein